MPDSMTYKTTKDGQTYYSTQTTTKSGNTTVTRVVDKDYAGNVINDKEYISGGRGTKSVKANKINGKKITYSRGDYTNPDTGKVEKNVPLYSVEEPSIVQAPKSTNIIDSKLPSDKSLSATRSATVFNNLSMNAPNKFANIFPSFNTSSGEVIYGRNSEGQINKVVKYSVNKNPEPSPTEPKMNLFQKGLSNVAGQQEINTDIIKGFESKYSGNYTGRPSAKEWGKYYGAAAGSLALGVAEGVGYPLFYPKETAKGLINQVKHPIVTFNEVKGSFNNNPARFLGQVYGGSKLIDFGGKGFGLVREGFIKVTAPKVSEFKYLEPKSSVLISQGKTSFPTVKSISDSLNKFSRGKTNEGSIKIVSASPEPVASFGQSRIIKVGKGSAGLEAKRSLGLYASYYGGGSPYFFSIGRSEGYSLSLIPKLSNRPTLSVIEVPRIERIPFNVLDRGVIAENKFLVNNPGRTFVTGNTERKFNPVLKGWRTDEAEVVVTPGSKLKSSSKSILGYDERIVFMGKQIPVREYKLFEGYSIKDYLPKFKVKSVLKSSESGEFYYSSPKNISLGRGLLYNYSSKSTSKTGSSLSLSKSLSSYSINSSGLSLSRSYFNNYSSKNSVGSSLRSMVSSSKSGKSNNYSLNSSNKYYSSGRILLGNVKPPVPPPIKVFPNNKNNVLKSFRKSEKPIRYRYNPSLAAELFNIRGRKINWNLARSGLVVRPIVGG